MDTIENLKAAAGAEGPIRAGEVLDEKSWEARPWHERRETPPDDQPFCDIAASQVLAQMAALGGEMPKEQSFLAQSGGELSAWRGEFSWGTAWAASRGSEFWAWASSGGSADARVEVAGSQELWDEDLALVVAGKLCGDEADLTNLGAEPASAQ